MSTKRQRITCPGIRAICILLSAHFLLSASAARAITFGDWATNQGWPAHSIMPASLNAGSASIHSLADIGSYDWLTTPTTTLWLAFNQITGIEAGTFSGLGSLTDLDLRYNQIAFIQADGFSGLGNLNELWLDSNQITNLESGAFAGLENLTYLSLYGNQIANVKSGDFSGLESLTVLDFGTSQVANLESGAFAALGNLAALWLDGNRITNVESDAFAGLNNLTELFLYNNRITSIESGAFSGLGNLTRLDLDGNTSLTDLNLERADFFSLTSFDLSGNTNIARVSLRDATLRQASLGVLMDGGELYYTGIGELPGVTELDLSGVDFAAIADYSPLYAMNDLTDLWLVGVTNMDAVKLDILLGNLETMESPAIEGRLYMTRFDYDAFNAAGGGLLAAWDAEAGHHVELLVPGDANGDGIVNAEDAMILATNWGKTGSKWFDGDSDNDGVIGPRDASILAAHWGYGPTESTSVPEPAVLLLSAIGVVCLLGFRRRESRSVKA